MPKRHRYGRPYEDDHKIDRKHLFLPNICNRRHERPAQHLSSFAFKRFTIIAFFGRFPHSDGPTIGDDDDPLSTTTSSPSRAPVSVTRSEERGHPESPGQPATVQSSNEGNPPSGAQEHVRSTLQSASVRTDGSHGNGRAHDIPAKDGDYKQLDGPEALRHFIMRRLQAPSNPSMVLFMGAENSYASFSLENGRAMFKETTCNLANEGYFFWVIERESRVTTKPAIHLWESAQEFKTVIAAQKRSSGDTESIIYSGSSLAGLLVSLELVLRQRQLEA